MRFLRSAGLALALFAGLAIALTLFWTILLGPVMEGVWDRLPEGLDRWLFAGLAAFAVLSGLAAYFWLLASALRRFEPSPRALALHLLTTGLLPPFLAVLALWAFVANLRIGW